MIARAAQPEAFTLQLATVTPVEDLRRWLEAAPVGHKVVYASGVDLPRAADSVVLARQWQNQGLVNLFQLRDRADARRWQFWMQRAGTAEVVAAPVSLDDTMQARADWRKMLGLLRDHAEAGRSCPSNRQLAEAMGWDLSTVQRAAKGRARVQYLLGAIERAGAIRIESRGTNAPRIVTIIAAGRATGRSTASAGP